MKINKFMQAININPAKKAEETFPKTKPMPADSVSFSHSVKPSNDQKFIELREDISKKMQPLLSGSEEAGWDFYINSTAENMDKMNAAQDKVNEFYDDKEVYKKLKAINDNGGVVGLALQSDYFRVPGFAIDDNLRRLRLIVLMCLIAGANTVL